MVLNITRRVPGASSRTQRHDGTNTLIIHATCKAGLLAHPHTYIHTNIHIHIPTYIYTYSHTYMYTYITNSNQKKLNKLKTNLKQTHNTLDLKKAAEHNLKN